MLSVLELSVFFFSDRGLHLVERLLNEHTILHIQNSISITLDVRVVSHHHASGRCVFTFALGANSVDIEDQVHNRHS